MINRDIALKLWDKEIGDKEYSYDFTGRKIKRSDYLIENQVGWVITYVRPLEKGGPDHINNIIIMHHNSLHEKGEDYPKFVAASYEYIAKYDENEDFYYIEKIIHDDDEDESYFI